MPDRGEGDPSVAVCIATYQRPELLQRLLVDLAHQHDPPRATVVIVADNDSRCSARPVAAWAAEVLGLDIEYLVEPVKGVSNARNAAVRHARTDFVAFIDDDDRPEPCWLRRLLAVQRSHDADVVRGRLIEELDAEVPSWYTGVGFEQDPEAVAGEQTDRAYSGNALIRRSCLDPIPGPFDERFNRTGGEDVYLSMVLRAHGCSFRWAPHAIVRTSLPPERLRVRACLRRSFVGAANYSRAERIVRGRPNPKRLLTGPGRIAAGATRFGAGLATADRRRAMEGLVEGARGAGIVAGALTDRALLGWW